MTNESWVLRCLIACATIWALQSVRPAQAQAPLRAAVFKTAVEQSALTPLGAALDPVLADELGKAKQLSIVATPALDLPGLQLAVDCVGETPSCLALAAERSHADGVIAPSLSHTQTEVVFSLLLFDPQRASGNLRVVTKRVARQAGDSAVLSAAVDLVREVFGIAPPPPPTAAEPAPQPAELPPPPEPVESAPHDSTLDAEPMPQRSPSLVLPISLGIAGVIGLGVGVGFGVASKHAEDAYGKQRVLNETDAGHANDHYDSAKRSAIIADVGFGVGAAALVAATIVWIVQGSRADSNALDETRTRLAFAPGHISLQGGWR